MRLSPEQYGAEKPNHFFEVYDKYFEAWFEKEFVLLEIGVRKGGSLLFWHDYFPNAKIVGIDIRLPEEFESKDRIHLYEGNQADLQFLSEVATESAPEGFDVIIDDGSHIGELTKFAFWHLFEKHLKPGGLYSIEDWGTGYWSDWLDGKSVDLPSLLEPHRKPNLTWLRILNKLGLKSSMRCHSYGMVGFVKQLVDEQGAPDVTRQSINGKPKRKSRFESLTINPSIVLVRKANHRSFNSSS